MNITVTPIPSRAARRKPFYTHLYFQVLLGFILGALIGFFFPRSAPYLKPLADAFIKLIRMLLAPIIFGTVVVGIAQMGSLKEVGRVGLKSIFYFEIVTSIALLLGLVVVNVIQPGFSFNADLASFDPKSVASFTTSAHEQTVLGFFLNIIPTSIAEAFVTGNMLQVIFFSVLFGLAIAQLPNRGQPVISLLDTILHALFNIVRYIMYLAPLAALGATAYTIGTFGLGALGSYAKLLACLYITSGLFVFFVLGTICHLAGIPFLKFLAYIKDEILITFATASTETVLPRMMEKLERLGCAKPVVGLVLPAGYTFNADGGCIYMTMAALFLAQATNIHLSLQDQLVILGVCLFTSKGSAGVAGAAFIALAATLSSMDKIPVASLVLLLGVDRFLNEARAVTNLIGNGVATIAVARWEKALDLPASFAALQAGGDQVVGARAEAQMPAETNA
jgi:DAACS family dicarboxylate/amino acid:cation (Na+ or H+) symporter/aerobic C4-dicarboxylate transport protein